MRYLKYFALVGALIFAAGAANAQVRVGIGIGVGPAVVAVGPAPVCAWGYYAYYPYACAPYGYYGPEWFTNGIFIGAGPWFHGPAGFHGYVNNHFHPAHGYKGPMPQRGERAVPAQRVDAAHFKGNEMRDGRGHVVKR